MAFDKTELAQIAYANGHAVYIYAEDDDPRATVMASGYINNADDDVLLRVDDKILVIGDGGDYTLRVDTVSAAGVVTTDMAGAPVWMSVLFRDIGSAGSEWLVAPFDGLITRVKAVIYQAIDADTVLGLELANVNVTGGQLTLVASGSATGDVFESNCTALNIVSEGTAVEIDTDAANSDPDDAALFVEFMPA